MAEKDIEGFKKACGKYFYTQGLFDLRSYGRELGMRKPTALKKSVLIEEIIGVLCNEIVQQRNNRGAPIKYDSVDPRILETVERFKRQYLEEGEPYEEETQEAPKQNGGKVEKEPISLRFIIYPSLLSPIQKDLLNKFLESL